MKNAKKTVPSVQDDVSSNNVGNYPWKTPYNAGRYPKYKERRSKDMPSLTVPDQTMSLDELVARYSRNMPLVGAGALVKVPIYEGDEHYFADYANMDPVDQQRYAKALKEEMEEIQKRKIERDKKIVERRKKQHEEMVDKAAKKVYEEREAMKRLSQKGDG